MSTRRQFIRLSTLLGTASVISPTTTGLVHAYAPESLTRQSVLQAMDRAAKYYSEKVASHGGYVYHYSLDLTQRWGEGKATADQIWVQPPGTPTAGIALLNAFHATKDPRYLKSATAAGEALVYGQLKSGGWANSIDFDPQGSLVSNYRNNQGKGRNYSTFDDGITPSALRYLWHLSRVLTQQSPNDPTTAAINESVQVATQALFAAQFANGGFPQVWDQPVAKKPSVQASYPNYEWRTENRVKEYWNLYTLNDDTLMFISRFLLDAWQDTQDQRFLDSLRKVGEFLILAQMPMPQPAWAQQYTFEMHPAWARKFEPPAIAGRESMTAVELLMLIYRVTQDEKFLKPIPAALDYLDQSHLADGQIARFYELRTNRPLYMNARYELTYDDSDTPDHYGWKHPSMVKSLRQRYTDVKSASNLRQRDSALLTNGQEPLQPPTAEAVQAILNSLDAEGRWVSTYAGERLVGQPKLKQGQRYLSTSLWAQNLDTLSHFLLANLV